MLFLVLGLADIARATTSGFAGGKSWQIGDIIVCFGSGTCNVIRITSGGPVLLDQIFDSPQGQPLSPGVANPGNTRGVAINNTLHAVVTDDAGGGGSNVVVYSIASVSPLTGSTVPHTPLHVFDASGGSGSANAQTIAIGSNGHMFVGNAINGGAQASIVELSPTGSSLGSFLIPNVTTPAWVANNAYALNATVLDPNGHLQKVTTAGTSGPLFPPFKSVQRRHDRWLNMDRSGTGRRQLCA